MQLPCSQGAVCAPWIRSCTVACDTITLPRLPSLLLQVAVKQ